MAYVVIVVLIILFLFLLNGYIWQALDEEEFPSEELPVWFVKRVREPLLSAMRRAGMKTPLDFNPPSSDKSKGGKSENDQ